MAYIYIGMYLLFSNPSSYDRINFIFSFPFLIALSCICVEGAAIELTTITPTIVDNFTIPIKLTAIEHQMPSELWIIMLLKESVSDR